MEYLIDPIEVTVSGHCPKFTPCGTRCPEYGGCGLYYIEP